MTHCIPVHKQYSSLMEQESIIPRNVCSSACQWDALWVSQIVLHSADQEDLEALLIRCERYWSPGFVIVIPPGKMDTVVMKDLATKLVIFSQKLGKARRITSGTPISHEIMELLYQSFYCVEFMNAIDQMQVMDDGKATVVEARLIN